jgi:hypothetical protein
LHRKAEGDVIELAAVFWLFVALFGIIGLMRGWVKETQATAAAVLGMFIIEQFGAYAFRFFASDTAAVAADPLAPLRRLVMLKSAVLLIVVFFGYQGPVLIQVASRGRAKSNRPRETLQEGLLGLVVGLINGYLIVGALWWYLHVHGYPFDWVISVDKFPESASFAMVRYLPLAWLVSPLLEVLVVLFFLFVIIAVI